MKETKRALRRHHRARRLRRAMRIHAPRYEYAPGAWFGPDEDWVRRNFEHLTIKCSCRICRNGRKWEGPTFQERRFDAGTRIDWDL
jgi:hypothetical protein